MAAPTPDQRASRWHEPNRDAPVAARRRWPRARPCAAAAALCSICAASLAPAQEGRRPLDESTAKLDGVTVTDAGGVNLHVADLPLADVLQLLSLEAQRNIIASPNVTGSVTANLYDVTLEEALNAILMTNDAGYREVGRFIYVHTKDELAKLTTSGFNQLATRVFPLNYVSAEDAATYVAPLLIEGETVTASSPPTAGLESESVDGGGDANAMPDFIIVVAYQKTIREVQRVLDIIDVRPQQVLVEATILRAALSDENALGIDFSLVGGVDLEMLNATSNSIQDIALGQLPTERYELFNAIASTSLSDVVPGGGMTLGIIKDHVAIFLRALEQVTDTTVLANPKILALNKQKGQVIVGRRDGYLTTTVTETQSVQKVEFLETGTQLIFRPFIGNDGFVRMELHPEDSVGFVNAQGLPSEQTTEVTTNVLVRDGQTILIGGLFREVTTDTANQVPGLGRLPGVGPLFRAQSDSTSREEVIILLTVQIVKDQDAFADASRELYDDVERIRVGARRGLMWHGRERVAQAHYRKALAELEEKDTEKALWHLKMSLHNYSRFLPAFELMERVRSERAWDDGSSLTRGFLYGLVARERGYRLVPFGRPDTAKLLETQDDLGGSEEGRATP